MNKYEGFGRGLLLVECERLADENERLRDELERCQRALRAMCRGWKQADLTEAEFLDAWSCAEGVETRVR